jgi:propanol-preferring alcohol dehydrogenase
MKAMLLHKAGSPLLYSDLARPVCNENQVLLKVRACGVCRTDLHIVDGELDAPKLPLIPGHEIVGEVIGRGKHANRFALGQRLGVPWLGHTCGSCPYCDSGRENLCDTPGFTGYTLNGGYAEYAVAEQDYCFPLPAAYADAEAAPLLCAGLIGYRALLAAGDAKVIGIYGFGAAAHIIAQVAHWQGRTVFAFTKPGDDAGQQFARTLGANWAGDSSQAPPQAMDAAILFAPVGALVPEALRRIVKGGTVVCAGIHMSDIPAFPYSILWGERTIRSIANLTRKDGDEFLAIAARTRIVTHVQTYPLRDANLALSHLKNGQLQGAAVLLMD